MNQPMMEEVVEAALATPLTEEEQANLGDMHLCLGIHAYEDLARLVLVLLRPDPKAEALADALTTIRDADPNMSTATMRLTASEALLRRRAAHPVTP